MKYVNSISSYLLFITIVLLAGCGGDNDGFPTGGCGGEGDPCPAYAVELIVTPQLNTLAVATDEQYVARATYSDGTQREVTSEVTWSSSLPDVASITLDGVASAEAKGSTDIVATLAASQAGPEVSDSAILHVTDATITSLTIEPGQAETLVGLTQGFKAVALFADSHVQDVTRYTDWGTSTPTVATISNEELSKGLATGVMAGATQVLGSYSNMSATAQLIVLDSVVDKLLISPVDMSFPVGTGIQYRADLIFEDGLSMDVTAQSSWQSSITSVASINSDARLTGLQTGKTQVSASLNFADVSVSDSTSATVTQSVVTQIVVSPDNLIKPVGTQGNYHATAYYSDGTTADVTHDATWSVDDKSIAVIVESGEMAGHTTAISPGIVEVTAAFQNLSGVVNAEVTQAVIESIDISPLDYVTPSGTQVNYTARARFSDASVHDITLLGYWQSSEMSVANIGTSGAKAGAAHAKSPGVTEISINYMGLEQLTTLTVTNAAISGLQVTPKNLQKPQGTRGQYSAIANYTDGHTEDVTSIATWSSANPSIVSVVTSGTNGGYATANDVGTTVIQATYAGFKASSGQLAPSSNVQSTASSISDSTSATVTNAVLEKLIISPLAASISAGNTQQYNLTGIFSDGTSKEVTEFADWQVSGPSVASIDNMGKSLGLTPGKTSILASYLGAQVQAELTVTDAVIERLEITPSKSQLPIGHEKQLVTTAFYSDGHSSIVTELATWSSQDHAIVEVVSGGSQAGKVYGAAQGSSIITADFDGMQSTAEVTVTTATLESVNLSPIQSTIPAGTAQQYLFTGIFSDGSNIDLTHVANWQSSVNSIASVDRTGLAASYQLGQTQIKASYIGFSATATLNVTDASLTGLQVTPANSSVPLGTSGQYQATAFYSDGHSSDVTQLATWSTADSSIASIVATGSTGGFAEAVGVGDTKVQARFEALTDSVNVSVTDSVLMSFSISPSQVSISSGFKQQYQSFGLFSDGSSKDLTQQTSWRSTQSSIATIERGGLALSYSAGETDIIGTYIGFNDIAKLTVTDAIAIELQVSPAKSQLPIGYREGLTAIAYYSDGHSRDVTQIASWRSQSPLVADVVASGESGGEVTAITSGGTEVDVYFGGLHAKAEVTVTGAILESVNLSPTQSEIPAGTTQQYSFIGLYSDGTNKDLTTLANWQSSQGAVASIDRAGMAQSYINGQTQIMASYIGFSATATLNVTDASLTGLQVTPANSSVPLGTSGQYQAMAFYSDGHSSDVTQLATWSTADSSIASIVATGSTGGLAEAVGVGDTKVQASFEALSDLVDVSVTDAILAELVVSPFRETVSAGLTQQYTATGIFSDGVSRDLTNSSFWSSSDEEIASINHIGVATGYSIGEVTVTANYVGFTSTATLIVTDAALSYIQVTPANVKVPIGTKGQFEAWAFYTDNHSEDITKVASWSSLNEDLVHISTGVIDGGYATALMAGSTQVEALFDGMSSVANVEVTAAEVIELTISPENKTVPLGLSQPYQAFARFTDGSSKEVTLASSWQSSNLKAATIDMQGLAQTTIGGGEYQTVIKATYKGLTAETNLYVGEAQLEEIQVTPATAEVNINEFQQYIATALFSDGYSADISGAATWTAVDTSIAHVVSSGFAAGRVTGDSQGSTRINAHYYGMDGQAEIVVTELEYLGVDVEPADSHVIVNETIQMQALAIYKDSSGSIVSKDVTAQSIWSVENREKISINAAGLVTGVEAGESEVYAEFQGHRAEGRVNVLNSEVISLEVTPDNLAVPIGTKGRYTAIATMYNTSLVDVTDKATWSSSNPDVIHMVTTGADGGTATATGVGSSTITAEYDGAVDSVTTQVNAVSLVKLAITPRIEWITSQVAVPFFATATFSDGSELDVTRDASWVSSNPREVEIGTGDERAGIAVGQYEAGSATISATYKGLSDQLSLSVAAREAVSIEILPENIVIEVGSYQFVEVWVHFNDGSSENYADYVDWNSSDYDIAHPIKHEVDGIGAGTAVITATFDGQSGTANVEVVPAS